MSIEKEFVPYNESLELKELGFNESCFGYYYTLNGKDWKFAEKSEYYRLDDELMFGPQSVLLTPTFSQAFRFFREKYGLSGWVDESFAGDDRRGIISIKSEIGLKYRSTTTGFHKTYEEVELACLRKLIEIVKDGKNANS